VTDRTAPLVLDASAVLAFVKKEPGAEFVRPLLAECALSALNYSEIVQKALHDGIAESELADELDAFRIEVHDFTREDALRVGRMWSQTMRYGLSLADRACLVLAQRLGSHAVTADRAWRGVENEFDIVFIR
jgi:ribonuclease VapC